MRSNFDLDELARLCESRYALVLQAARKYAPGSNLDRDIVQETFLTIVQGAIEGKWDLTQDVNPLFYGIAKNIALHCWREERKTRSEGLQIIDSFFLSEAIDLESLEAPQGQEDLTTARLAGLESCLKKLSSRNRKLLEQHYRHGISMEKLAVKNGIRSDNMRQIFSRLRAKLCECIERYLKTER